MLTSSSSSSVAASRRQQHAATCGSSCDIEAVAGGDFNSCSFMERLGMNCAAPAVQISLQEWRLMLLKAGELASKHLACWLCIRLLAL
jgi:hypothetical protein